MQVATSTSCNPWRFGLFFSVTVPGVPAAQDFKSWKNERENFCRPKDPLGHLQSYHRDEGVFLMFFKCFFNGFPNWLGVENVGFPNMAFMASSNTAYIYIYVYIHITPVFCGDSWKQMYHPPW